MIFNYFPHHSFGIIDEEGGLRRLFLSTLIRGVSISLLTLFSSVYIVETFTARGFNFKSSLLLVVAFYFVLFVSKLMFLPIAENLSLKFGYKKVGAVSCLPFMFFIWSFLQIGNNLLWLYLSAFLWGANTSLFWWAYHGIFARFGNKNHFGRSLGKISFASTSVSIVTPLVGAVVIESYGFGSTFFLSILLVVVSSVVLLTSVDTKQSVDVKLKDVFKLLLKKKEYSAGYLGNAFESTIYLVVWPLVVFVLLGGVLQLGEVASLATLIAAFFTYIIGKRVDKVGEEQVIAAGTPYLALSWIARAFSSSASLLVISDTMWRVAQGMVSLPMNVTAYKKALDGGVSKAILFRDISFVFGNILALMVIGLWIVLGFALQKSFLIAAVFSLLPLWAIKNGEESRYEKG